MKKICVIFTGGTIGSSIEKGIINTKAINNDFLLEKYKMKYPNSGIEFFKINPINTLSENMTFEKWEKLINFIKNETQKNYDGIIILHGTDTLSYTSCMLSYVFEKIDIPLVMVSSNKPLEDESGNGFDNFVGAIDFILTSKLKGVFVSYKDKYAHMNIHLGIRTTQANQLDGEISSAYGINFGEIKNHKFIENPKFHFDKKFKNFNLKSIKFTNDFMFIAPYTGMNYEYFKSYKKPKFILHELYHSGTACCDGSNTSLLDFAKYCKKNEIKLYLAPMDINQISVYKSSELILENGVKIFKGITIEAILTKLMIAYGTFSEITEIQNFIERNIVNEYIEKP